jgi:hypothetical protein
MPLQYTVDFHESAIPPEGPQNQEVGGLRALGSPETPNTPCCPKTRPAAELKRAYPAAHMNLGILLGTQFPFTNWACIR